LFNIEPKYLHKNFVVSTERKSNMCNSAILDLSNVLESWYSVYYVFTPQHMQVQH